MRGATLMAQPFDPTRLTTAGQAVALADSGEIIGIPDGFGGLRRYKMRVRRGTQGG